MLNTDSRILRNSATASLLNPAVVFYTIRDFLHSSGTRPGPEQSVD